LRIGGGPTQQCTYDVIAPSEGRDASGQAATRSIRGPQLGLADVGSVIYDRLVLPPGNRDLRFDGCPAMMKDAALKTAW